MNELSEEGRKRYAEWRGFYQAKVTDWMTADELREAVGLLHTAGKTASPELLLIHAMNLLDQAGQRAELKPQSPCPACDDGEGNCAFPHYGTAPHRCGYLDGKPFVGSSVELPESEWPANFQLDPDSGPPTGYPRAGIWTHCLQCGAGEKV